VSSKGIVGCAIWLLVLQSGLAQDLGKKLEPYFYRENFESNELRAWASYPLWQDTAFDPNLRPQTLRPGDPNISLVQRVTPYSFVDSYAGAQKKLDAYLLPGSVISLKYYLKTHLEPEFFKIRLASGSDGKVDVTFARPPANRWVEVSAGYEDIVQENPRLKGKPIKVNALAVLAKFPKADPAMPIYLGLDDVVLNGWQQAHFNFSEPKIFALSEWDAAIPEKHYGQGETLAIRGTHPLQAKRIVLEIRAFGDKSKLLLSTPLQKIGRDWQIGKIALNYPAGLYSGCLIAFSGREKLSATNFTLFIEAKNHARKHPRLWFDTRKLAWLKERLKTVRYKKILDGLISSAKEHRDKLPSDKVVFDIDNFPRDEPLLGNVPRSIYPWFDRIKPWSSALHDNALVFILTDDRTAGAYGKALLLRLCEFPFFLHPWFETRGQHIYYPVGELAMEMALGYDLLFELLNEEEGHLVRQAFSRNIISGCQRGYVENNLVTGNTSNWIAHITGGSLMCQAAMLGDGPDVAQTEPQLSGAIFKLNELIQKSLGRDGGYGESFGYCNFTMLSLSKALPALENVFGIDLSVNLKNTYQDIPWAGNIQAKDFFYFGDSSGSLIPLTNWAWYLEKSKDPLLGWLYHFLKQEETFMDALYNIEDVLRTPPFSENPVRVFRDIGTSVLRSGWGKDDFVFVMRTGAFYNHQHLDQGTFWLADRGQIFIEERHGSHYYDDPIYQSHYTQPIAHSTILIDRNPQSQRVGDPLLFAEGFDDHAAINDFLDGTFAAFLSGDIGRLYWGKARGIQRNVLYLKPRTLLMLDAVTPSENDADVTLLYQAGHLDQIRADPKSSSIKKGPETLTIRHLAPEKPLVEAIETPHYINTLKTENPLVKEGMLAVTARTEGHVLIMANLLTTLPQNEVKAGYEKGEPCGFGMIGKTEFVFSTKPGRAYSFKGMTTDALAAAWAGDTIFAAGCTFVARNGVDLLRSKESMTCEIRGRGFKCYVSRPTEISFRPDARPTDVFLGGKKIKDYIYDSKDKALRLTLPAGETLVNVK